MNETDDDHTKTAWEAYQSSGINYTDELIKAVYQSKLNASGLLLDKEIKKISDKVEKDKLLDDLFNPNATMAVTQYRANKLAGKSASHVWMDDPWGI